MKYTKEIPTKPGYYWMRYLGLRSGRILKIDIEPSGPYINRNGSLAKADNRFEYAGPIEEPEE